MSPRSSVTPESPTDDVVVDLEIDDRIARVGLAWRELRRGASMQALRERIYQGDTGLIDMGLADALEVVTLMGPSRMRDLAEALRVDPSTATRTVDRLEDRGLVERVPDADDARVVVVAATPDGERLRAQVRDQARVALGSILSEFTADEAETLAALMTRLVAAVDRYIEGEGAGAPVQNSSER